MASLTTPDKAALPLHPLPDAHRPPPHQIEEVSQLSFPLGLPPLAFRDGNISLDSDQARLQRALRHLPRGDCHCTRQCHHSLEISRDQ